MKKLLFLIPGMIFLINLKLFSQFTEFHPELNWQTIKGKHVVVHYHEEAERSARTVLKIAEEVWGPITSLYQYEPETVHFVIKDIDDYSNGATYFFDNKIEIWASALDFDLRGSHNWLRNVISHEFTHMVQIQSSLKTSRSFPALYLQFLNYEDKRRPDILYGFPNVIASFPLAGINVPAWFAEGTAQYMRKEFNYDNWDTHRDMILRSYSLDGNMLTWNQMGVFDKTSLGNESVYNSGFSLTRYIAEKYGEDKLRQISKALGSFGNFTIDAAIKDAIGKDGREVYDEWKDYLTKDYEKKIFDVKTNLVTGEMIGKEGFGNFYPAFSSDGSKIIYCSNKTNDYFSLSSLYLYDLVTKKEKMITPEIRSTLSWIPNINKIVYAKLSEDNPSWTNIHDLYFYDLDKEDETRLTKGMRTNQPSVSKDGSKIVFVFQKDGTTNIGTVDIDGKNFKRLTFFENGEQVFNPKFSNDDKFIVFDYAYTNGRDIAKVNPDGSGFDFLLQSKTDERNPVFGKDGKLYYSSDETGIFNIYSMDLITKEKHQLTNVIGGAYMPDVNSKGEIVYSGYTSEGYKIFLLPTEEQVKVDSSKKYHSVEESELSVQKKNSDIQNFDLNGLVNYNDKEIQDYKSEKYSGAFTKLTFFPFIRYDNYNTSNKAYEKIKPGLYISSTDMLDRFSLFAGGSINSRWERDLFLTFNYRNKLPLLFNIGIKPELSLEVYSISRKASADLLDGVDTTSTGVVTYDLKIPIDVTYDLFEFDIVASHRIFSRGNDLEFRFIFSQYKSTIGSFVYKDVDQNAQLSQKFIDTYLIGRNFQAKYKHTAWLPYVDDDINPVGREVELQYNYEMNNFNPNSNYEIKDGVIKSIYDKYNFHRLELNWKENVQLWKGHTIAARFRAGSILGKTMPDFFDYYLGGLIGMKSYPFYSINGNRVGWLNLTYRFPLFKNIDYKFGMFYLDKIFLSVYGDLGNAWNEKMPSLNTFKKGAGAEVRFKLNSFYLFPTSVFVNASYAFDEANRTVRNELVKYGKEWQFYGGILFDFSF
ncbi:MAG: biopolymer transporter Tol [Ignavibacteriales bacterium]|nr:biopolymer transporter Tol [Ignavibacteriales bacterium]